MNFIKGLVISGSYKGSIVTVLNEGFLLNGNIRVTHFHDICKYNVSLFKKSKEATGKKVVGDTTYLFKDSIVLQPNCLCQKDDCDFSHLYDKENCEKHEPGGDIKKMTGDILKCLLVKYNNTSSHHNIINMCISLDSHVSPYTTEMHENAFIHVAGLSIRSIIEQYCKHAPCSMNDNNKKSVRELVYLLRQCGYISVEKEIKLCDLLSFTNSIVHSTKKIDNTKDMLMKINNSLVSILYL